MNPERLTSENSTSHAAERGTAKGRLIGEHRPDIVVSDRVVVEVKSVERLIGVHQAQLLAYMRLLKTPQGLLLNFNGEILRTGIRRLVV
jgi:iron complex transport system substrate-binding protein